jgi:signal transduction histidine kinase
LGIVHEIKSPITAVQSILDLILSKYVAPIDEKVEEKLLRARARSNEAIALINDVLKYSRIKLLDSSLSDDIDLDEIIQKIISQHEDEIKLKKISFNFRNLVKGEKLIKGDKSLLELAFSNLISNAVKYTNDKGNIFVIITENENLLDIEISDDGIGIPEKELKDIFSQLYRASNAKKEGKEGSGMGLSIVKEIIEKHSGIIQIFSPSKIGTTTSPGTTVLITLPKKLNSNNY